VIQQRLQNSLAEEILAGRFPDGATIRVDGQLDGFVFTCEDNGSCKSTQST
jgi:ATP-dependent Clp protease ATP-binding subunit ClpA